jgi:hypothetical protein
MLLWAAGCSGPSTDSDAGLDSTGSDANGIDGAGDGAGDDGGIEDGGDGGSQDAGGGADESGELLHVQLRWHTPDDPNELDEGPGMGADLDLHLLHPAAPQNQQAADLDGDGDPDPYFDPRYDCYSSNNRPDWGEAGALHNPRLDRDDIDGAGPENINLDKLESGVSYRVAVYYVDDHGFGPSLATVQVKLAGDLVYESENVNLQAGDMWCVAFIDGDSLQVTACEPPAGQGPWITPSYPSW